MKLEQLELTREWDKTFPKSDRVNHSKVTFVNRYGITLAADQYVPKDVNGKLAKQYVKTGKTYWGTMVEILEGVTLEDYLAFPYGDGAKEGAKTKQDEMGVYY